MSPLLPAGYDIMWSLLMGVPVLLGLALVAAAIAAVVVGLRSLQRIDRSLQELVLQGVARGDGPHDDGTVAR